MNVHTLMDLAQLCEIHRDRDTIVISVDEWDGLRQHIAPERVVAATFDRPPFFWFRDKKIVTPAYVMAQRKHLGALAEVLG